VARVRRRGRGPEFDPAPGAGDVLWLRTPDLPAGGLFADEPFGTAGVAPAPDPRGYAATPAGAPALAWDDEAGPDPSPAGAAREAAPALDALAVPTLTQLRRTYLMFERGDGLVLIDQHSAHERVLYERFLGALHRGEAPSQHLLFPLTLHLTPAQAEAFDAHREALARLGYEAESFGGASVLVTAFPRRTRASTPSGACARRSTRSPATGSPARTRGTNASPPRWPARAAVKAGDPLSPDEMRALYVALARTTLPAHDVHGRATVVHVGWDEVERRFGRR
jgi:DNA mismatch repair protein MutL